MSNKRGRPLGSRDKKKRKMSDRSLANLKHPPRLVSYLLLFNPAIERGTGDFMELVNGCGQLANARNWLKRVYKELQGDWHSDLWWEVGCEKKMLHCHAIIVRKCPEGVRKANIYQKGFRSGARLCTTAAHEVTGSRKVFGTCQIKAMTLVSDEEIEEKFRNYGYLTKGLRPEEPQGKKKDKYCVPGECYKQTVL